MDNARSDQSRVMVVDDTPESLEMLTQLLVLTGYEVYPVTSGPSALDLVQHMLPDIILLDVMMPGMDGYEVCRRLKAADPTRDIPVIFISALNDSLDKVHAFQAGGIDYITKPFQLEEVLARVGTHLKLRDSQQYLKEKNIQLHQEIQDRQQAEQELHQRNQELFLVNRFSQMFSSSLEFDQVIDTILGELKQQLDVFSISVWLVLPETGELVCRQMKGPGSEEATNWRLAPGQGITGWVAQQGESVLIDDTWADERHFKAVDKKTGQPIRSMLSVPLKTKDEVFGVLNLVDLRVGHFTPHDLLLVEAIASAAASAIENARLYTMAQQEIAERKRAEEALRQVNEELQAVNESKDKFFSIISHDLRSAFHILLGYAQCGVGALTPTTPPTLKENVEKLLASADKLYALLENLLTWSRIQRGVMEYEPEVIDLFEIAEDNVELFLSKAQQKEVLLTSSVPSGSVAYADYNMIKTVIRNLVSNALKFTDAGDSIVISAWTEVPFMHVAVADTGVGISDAVKARLFRIDSQHTSMGTAGEKGTGLGLILCQELVERNGGRIWVESEPEQGATFHFTLPRNASAEGM